jgi:hypothetical protein
MPFKKNGLGLNESNLLALSFLLLRRHPETVIEFHLGHNITAATQLGGIVPTFKIGVGSSWTSTDNNLAGI